MAKGQNSMICLERAVMILATMSSVTLEIEDGRGSRLVFHGICQGKLSEYV